METTEEKAKAYDNALEKAKYWHREGYGKGCQEVVEDIFPELAESNETENISRADAIAWLEKQKEIYAEDFGEFINELSKQFPEVSFAKLSRIAVRVKNWLEKQGESYTKRDVDNAYIEGMAFAKKKLEKQGDKDRFIKEEIECIKGYREKAIKMLEEIEKQGGQKPAKNIVETWKDMRLEVYQQASGNRHEPNYSDDSTKMFSLNDIDEIFEKIAEKQGEQKFEMKSAEESLGISSEEYNDIVNECLYGESNSSDKVEPKFKVGDKIRRKIPRIYDKDMQVARIGKDYYLCNNLGKFSSEQISFSEESNYELVEHEPACSDNKKLTDVNHEYFSELLENNDSKDINDYAYQVAYCMSHDWIKETATWDDIQKACKLGAEWLEKHHKSAEWSEEDKDFMYDTLSNLAELKGRYGEGYGNVGKCIDWLKSLKGRVQPKQEWSVEDKLNKVMKQYIDKDALVAEIERLQDAIKATTIDARISKEQAEAYKVCVKLRSFVEDTIEVKEVHEDIDVDLNKKENKL